MAKYNLAYVQGFGKIVFIRPALSEGCSQVRPILCYSEVMKCYHAMFSLSGYNALSEV